jgi:hypothetical protein
MESIDNKWDLLAGKLAASGATAGKSRASGGAHD